MSLLANEFDAPSVLHSQRSLAAVNHIYMSFMSLRTVKKNLKVHLRNEFDFCKVHGIKNTSGLLQSKLTCTVNFARYLKYS